MNDALILFLVALVPAITALVAVGYWGGGVKKAVENVNDTLNQNLELIRDDHRELRRDVGQHAERITALEHRTCN